MAQYLSQPCPKPGRNVIHFSVQGDPRKSCRDFSRFRTVPSIQSFPPFLRIATILTFLSFAPSLASSGSCRTRSLQKKVRIRQREDEEGGNNMQYNLARKGEKPSIRPTNRIFGGRKSIGSGPLLYRNGHKD